MLTDKVGKRQLNAGLFVTGAESAREVATQSYGPDLTDATRLMRKMPSYYMSTSFRALRCGPSMPVPRGPSHGDGAHEPSGHGALLFRDSRRHDVWLPLCDA